MPRPTPLSRYLAAGFAPWFALLPFAATALTLGNLTVRSHLGEPLRAQVAVKTGANESIDETCIALPRPVEALEGLPYLSKARLSVENSASGQIIRIRTTQIINDPVFRVLLQVSCSGQTSLSREFTILLEPSGTARTTPATEEEALQRTPAEAVPKPGTPWEIRPGESLADIARAVYPNNPNKQQRLEQAIAAANPNVFSNAIQGDLPVGQILQIPELPALQHASTSARRLHATSATGSHDRAPDQTHARRATPPRSTSAETFQLKLSTGEIDLSVSRNMTEEDRLKLREKQLLLETDDQVANIMTLKNQVKQLEARLSELSLKMSADIDNKPQPAPSTVLPKTTLPAQTGKPAASSSLRNFWFGLGLLGISLGLFFTVRRYRRHNKALEQFHLDENIPLQQEEAEPTFAPAKPVLAKAKSPGAPNATVEETYYDPSSIFNPPDENITLTEMDSVVEEADLYLIYGWTDKAIDLLQSYIAKHPQEIQPWIMLLDIFRSEGKKEAFDKLARQFKSTIDDASQWSKVQDLGREFDPHNRLYTTAAHDTEEDQTQDADSKAPLPPTGSILDQAAQKAEDDYWAEAKTDLKPRLKK